MKIYAGMKLRVKKDPHWLAGKTPEGTCGEVVTSQLCAKDALLPYIALEFYAPKLKNRAGYYRGVGGFMNDEVFNEYFEVIP